MAQKSGFWNALLVNNGYDRKYNADDYSDNLAVVISNGVLKSTNDDLKVSANGLVVSVSAGRAWINGRYYYNDSTYTFAAITAPTGGSRYDRIMLRHNGNLETRSISLVYVQGTASNSPVKPTPTRSGNIYDLVLADIYVEANATSVTVTDKRADTSVCGWVYSTAGDNSFFTSLDNEFNTWFEARKNTLSSVTLFKRYDWREVLTAAGSTVAFNIPQYDTGASIIEVYVNGMLETLNTDYTLSGSTITFSGTLVAGTEIEVKCYKSIDGTGIQSVADEITVLQNQVDALEGGTKFSYTCTGANDNISLSQIAQALIAGTYTAADMTTAASAFMTRIGGQSFLNTLSSNSQITIEVVGTVAATTPFDGSGTSSSRYRWFSFGQTASNDKRIIFDFAKCDKIAISPSASTSNVIFFGTDLYIKNANVSVYTLASGCDVEMVAGAVNTGNINVENCKFVLRTSGLAKIATHGSFTNCYCKCISDAGHALCFTPKSASLIRLVGGVYYAYGSTNNTGAICYTYTGETNAVIMAHNINCPTSTLTNYVQSYLAVGYAGNTYIDGVVSTLGKLGDYVTVNGQIQKSKPI